MKLRMSKPVPQLDEPTIIRFWSKVNRRNVNECWPWLAGLFARGYGAFKVVVGPREYRQIHASRISLFLATGNNGDGLLACHTCDNPICCNPSHLFWGTPLDNERDKWKKGRQANRFGDANPYAKLNSVAVLEIRNRVALGETQAALAKEYGVNQSTVSCVCSGRTWKVAA